MTMPSWMTIVAIAETAAFVVIVGGCFIAGIYRGLTKDECEDEHPMERMNELHYTHVDGASAYWYAIPRDCRPDSIVPDPYDTEERR